MPAMSFEEYVRAYYKGLLPISGRYGIRKADDPLSTADTTYFNTQYGAAVFMNLLNSSDIWKLLPKVPWTQSGKRMVTARTASATNAGVAEGAAFPETDIPDVVELSVEPKEIISPWEATTKALLLSEADDGIPGIQSWLRKQRTEEHLHYIDAMLMADAEAAAAAAGADRTTTDLYNMESLDRIISSGAEETQYGNTYNQWYDPWGTTVDRDSGTTYDSYVSHGSGTDRALTLTLIDTMIESALTAGANINNLIFLTGGDTAMRISQLLFHTTGPAWRLDAQVGVNFSINGVSTATGADVNGHVAAYNGIPIFTSQHVPKDTISRIYLLDLANLHIKVGAPTTFVSSEDLAILQKMSYEYALITVAEIDCTNFSTQGKLRDLKVS